MRVAGGILIALALVSAEMVKARTPEQKSIDIQRGRERRVKTRGEKVYYTNVFDLSGLPKYAPEQKVTGTLRIWGLNYLTDGKLAKYWEDGFRKFQPGINFSWFTPTALVAIPGLYSGQADLARADTLPSTNC